LIADALGQKIARRIRAEGPLSVAAYMAMALHDPEGGYYARRDPIGAQGDFITAPEISQVFGELIGVWCAVVWEQLGRPDPVILAELGPGRGVLIADLLRATATVPGFRRALRLYLLEASAPLRAEQERRLTKFGAVWVSRLDDLPEQPMLVIANEFLDALPIRQFVRRGGGWLERMVTLDREDRFVFVEGPLGAIARVLVPPAGAPGSSARRTWGPRACRRVARQGHAEPAADARQRSRTLAGLGWHGQPVQGRSAGLCGTPDAARLRG